MALGSRVLWPGAYVGMGKELLNLESKTKLSKVWYLPQHSGIRWVHALRITSYGLKYLVSQDVSLQPGCAHLLFLKWGLCGFLIIWAFISHKQYIVLDTCLRGKILEKKPHRLLRNVCEKYWKPKCFHLYLNSAPPSQNTTEKGKARSKNRLLWLEIKSKIDSQLLVKPMEWFSACYQLVWSALKPGSIGDPSHTCIASHG